LLINYRKFNFANLIKYHMENNQAHKLIEKIQKEILQNKFSVEDAVTDLKKVREISLGLNNPLVTKALRLAYEHLENNNAFFIGIPEDDPIDDNNVALDEKISVENNLESLNYFLSLFTDLSKKNNLLDLKEYNKAFLSY